MSRNRRTHGSMLRFAPGVKAFLLCALIGGSGIVYVWQKDQIVGLNEHRRQLELKLEQARRQNDLLLKTLAGLQDRGEVEMRLRQMNLGLVAPQQEQIVHLLEPPPVDLRSKASDLYVAGR